MCLDIITSPAKTIERIKKKKAAFPVTEMLASSFIFAIAGVIALYGSLLLLGIFSFVPIASFFAVMLLMGVIILLLLGLVVQLAAKTMGGKSGGYEGLTAVAYASVPFSTGFLLASLLILVPFVGVLLAIIASLPLFALSFATLYRTVKELFKIDIVTTTVVVGAALMAAVFAVLVARFLAALSLFAAAGF